MRRHGSYDVKDQIWLFQLPQLKKFLHILIIDAEAIGVAKLLKGISQALSVGAKQATNVEVCIQRFPE